MDRIIIKMRYKKAKYGKDQAEMVDEGEKRKLRTNGR